MKKSVFVVATLAVVLGGCSSAPKLTEEGASIQNVSNYSVKECKQLSVAEGYGTWDDGQLAAAEIDLKNKVAAAGGNAMHVVQEYTVPRRGQGAIIAYVLRCNVAAK